MNNFYNLNSTPELLEHLSFVLLLFICDTSSAMLDLSIFVSSFTGTEFLVSTCSLFLIFTFLSQFLFILNRQMTVYVLFLVLNLF